MSMGMHQSPRDARGTAEQFEADSPHLQDEMRSRAKYEHQLEDEAAGKKPSALERFKRWFSARF